MERRPVPAADEPRAEPEIIPPGEAGPHPNDRWSQGGTHRIYVTRVGPFGLFAIALAALAVLLLVVLLIVGAFLLWLPVAAVLVAIAVVSGLWRGRWRADRRPFLKKVAG
jgi:hypothetical protein